MTCFFFFLDLLFGNCIVSIPCIIYYKITHGEFAIPPFETPSHHQTPGLRHLALPLVSLPLVASHLATAGVLLASHLVALVIAHLVGHRHLAHLVGHGHLIAVLPAIAVLVVPSHRKICKKARAPRGLLKSANSLALKIWVCHVVSELIVCFEHLESFGPFLSIAILVNLLDSNQQQPKVREIPPSW